MHFNSVPNFFNILEDLLYSIHVHVHVHTMLKVTYKCNTFLNIINIKLTFYILGKLFSSRGSGMFVLEIGLLQSMRDYKRNLI